MIIKKIKKENDLLRKRCNDIVLEVKNIKKKFENEIKKTKNFSCFKIIKNLLPVIDSLEITYRNSKNKIIKEGIKMTIKMIKDIFKKNKVTKISPKKYEKFDPSYHQAILRIKCSLKSNLIYDVLQKGYKIINKILRPALVSVTCKF
ncbi:nucleotide exchange factor GrpE [Candidatus Vidania fulgoroideorum]